VHGQPVRVRDHRLDRLRELPDVPRLGGMDRSARADAEAILGRGYLSIGRLEDATAHLDSAWRLGKRTQEVALARGMSYARRYEIARNDLRSIHDEELHARRLAKLQAELRAPALEAFAASGDSPLVRAEIAVCDERWEDAIAAVPDTTDGGSEPPEALLLRARAFAERAVAQKSDADAYHRDFDLARASFLSALQARPSDFDLAEAACALTRWRSIRSPARRERGRTWTMSAVGRS
jgi:hypothetical protein